MAKKARTHVDFRIRYRLGHWEHFPYGRVEAGGTYDHENQWKEGLRVEAWQGDDHFNNPWAEVNVNDRALAELVFGMLWSRYPNVTLRDYEGEVDFRRVENMVPEYIPLSVRNAQVCCAPFSAPLSLSMAASDTRANLEAIRRAQMPKAPRGSRSSSNDGQMMPKLRARIMERDNFRCKRCGNDSTTVALEVDHIIPRAKGGTNDERNLQTLCWSCNRGKGTSDPLPHELEQTA